MLPRCVQLRRMRERRHLAPELCRCPFLHFRVGVDRGTNRAYPAATWRMHRRRLVRRGRVRLHNVDTPIFSAAIFHFFEAVVCEITAVRPCRASQIVVHQRAAVVNLPSPSAELPATDVHYATKPSLLLANRMMPTAFKLLSLLRNGRLHMCLATCAGRIRSCYRAAASRPRCNRLTLPLILQRTCGWCDGARSHCLQRRLDTRVVFHSSISRCSAAPPCGRRLTC